MHSLHIRLITLHSIQRLSFALLFLIPFLFLSGGCAKLNCTKLENLLGGKTNLLSLSYKIADSLIEQAHPPLVPNHPDMPVLITTFVDNNDLTHTTKFGRLLQQHISSRFVQRRYTIREFKLGETLYIEPKSGITVLTRDLTKIEGAQNAQAILVGTFSHTNRTLYISTRLVNPNTSTVISSDDYQLCMDSDILNLLNLRLDHEGTNMIEEPSQPLLNKIL